MQRPRIMVLLTEGGQTHRNLVASVLDDAGHKVPGTGDGEIVYLEEDVMGQEHIWIVLAVIAATGALKIPGRSAEA